MIELARLPRVKIAPNRKGSVCKWLLAIRRNWWFMRPIRMAKKAGGHITKVHIYGILRRGVWKPRIQGIEITPNKIIIVQTLRDKP